MAASIEALGNVISTSGKGSVVLIVLFRHFFYFSMNSMLGHVKSLGYITHYMII